MGTSIRTRSRSRPSRPNSPPLHRLLSTQFPDDHSVYHHEDGEGVHVDPDALSLHKTETERRENTSLNDDSSSMSDEINHEKDEEAGGLRDGTTLQEIRGGIPDERDIEAQAPPLQKKESSRSIRDPDLVSLYQRTLHLRLESDDLGHLGLPR